MRCGFPFLFTTARASSVSCLRFVGDPCNVTGRSWQGLSVPLDCEIEQAVANFFFFYPPTDGENKALAHHRLTFVEMELLP